MKFIKAQREAEKTKLLLEETLEKYGLLYETEEQVPRRRPRTRGLKRALELGRQKERELPDEVTLNEKFSVVISEDKEGWLQEKNDHLEKLLKRAKKYNHIQIRMAKHYAKRNKIARSKLKKANAKIEILTMQEEKRRLNILVEASLHA